jgi:protein-S-isoprenylcysteine O-methyltransferase Ste14
VLVPSGALALVLWLCRPVPAAVWVLSGPPSLAASGGFGLGLAIMAWANLAMEPEEFLGLRQVERHYGDAVADEPMGFRTPGLYRYVRHPLYLGFLLVFWSTPEMSAGRLLFAAGATAYVLVGARFEEKGLLRRFGKDYARYREEAPLLIPRSGASR